MKKAKTSKIINENQTDKNNQTSEDALDVEEPSDIDVLPAEEDLMDEEFLDSDISDEPLNDMDFPDNVEIMDPDLLPEDEIIKNAQTISEKEKNYETISVDVDSADGMLALRNAFKPQTYASGSSTDPLTLYLSHIRNHPILDAESQQKLAIRYKKDNDLEAAQMLVLTNLRLVVKIAREYRRRWANLLELIQEGNVGLSEAIQRYDPYRHVKFTSYAQYWIRAMILNHLMNHFQPIRIGSTRAGRKLFYNLKKARAQLQQEGHTNPTPALVAEKLGVSEQDVIDVSRQLDQPALSIDQNAPGYENVTIGELIRDDDDSPEQIVAHDEFYAKVHDIMVAFASSLTDPRELALWNRRLMSDNPITLAELGTEYHISKERIRQIEMRLKERFKEYISERIDGDISTFIE